MATKGAIFSGALIAALAATPATGQTPTTSLSDDVLMAGPFRLQPELDAGLVFAAGDSFGEYSGIFGDLDIRLRAEAITGDGMRWGTSLRLRTQADHGRDGFEGSAGTCLAAGPSSDCLDQAPQARSLATGRYNSIDLGQPDRVQAALEEAYVFVRTGWFEVRAGRTPGAAALDQPRPPSASRLVTAGGGPIDPTGLESGLAFNRLTGISTRLLIRSERILGVSLAVSHTGQTEGCGVDYCVHETVAGTLAGPAGGAALLQGNTLNRASEAGLTFDHTFREAGRIELGAGLLLAEPDRARAGEGDLTAWSLAGRWTRGGWSAGVSHLDSSTGRGQGYEATALALSHDRGDWRLAAEGAISSDDFLHEDSRLIQIGISLLVGDHALLGAGLRTIETDGALSTPAGRIQRRREATSLFVELGVRY